jgi:UDP-glucose 4-epimerase
VTGSAGHLGEALMRTLPGMGYDTLGIDITPSPFTAMVGSITDRAFVRRCIDGVDAVIHAATLHKPHVVTHSHQAFVDTNVSGTLNLLEEAAAAGVDAFVFTSTTSAFGRALTPDPGMPAAWITEHVAPLPRNIYGVTKVAAENLCELVHRNAGMPCVILRTSRFFPEPDDNAQTRQEYDDSNAKMNELLYRRVDIEDVVAAHLLAIERAPSIRFGRYIITATTPFAVADIHELRIDAPSVVRRRVPEYVEIYAGRGWSMFPVIDRVYANGLARAELGWKPHYDFARALSLLSAGEDHQSPLARAIGAKGYHSRVQQRSQPGTRSG